MKEGLTEEELQLLINTGRFKSKRVQKPDPMTHKVPVELGEQAPLTLDRYNAFHRETISLKSTFSVLTMVLHKGRCPIRFVDKFQLRIEKSGVHLLFCRRTIDKKTMN
eukprot:SAG31_NODE_1544_length_7943_cov_4.076237_9_plen_108_part_00